MVTKDKIVIGAFFKLKSRLGASKIFKAGAVIKIVKAPTFWSERIDNSINCIESFDGRAYGGYESIYFSNLIPLTAEEVENMNKPSTHMIVEVGTTNFQIVNEANKDATIQKLLTAKPAAKIAIYALQGVAEAVPVEVKFTTVHSL